MAKRCTRRFKVRDDTGRQHQAEEWTDFISAASFEENAAQAEGLKELRLANGQRLNWLEKGRYQEMFSGTIFTSDDPDAP